MRLHPLDRSIGAEIASAKFAEFLFHALRWIRAERDPQNLSERFGARSIGYIWDSVLWKGGHKEMYWYNPTTHSSEKVASPPSDSQAIQMLAGTQDSAEFIKEYLELRRSGTPIAQALVLVGHEFRLRQPEYQLVLR
jgi:hypothetical protein